MVQIKNHKLYNSQTVHMRPASEVLSEDWTSIQGQFGWIELCNTMMPYLTRRGQKYVSLRMADSKILSKYHQYFSDEIRNCYSVEKLKITKAEAALLNEINFRHCDNSFGRIEFTTKDEIVTSDDIKQMYDFLIFCKTMLLENANNPKKCGFIKIASQNCVPYVLYEDKQYVPLFYFEGECKYLEEKAIDLRGWELAYLKLACKVQGIRKALFDTDSIPVVELSIVEKFFPSDTVFEFIWLRGTNVSFLLNTPFLPTYSTIVSIKGPLDRKSKGKKEQNSPQLQKQPAPVTQSVGEPKNQNGMEPSPMVLPMNDSHPQQNICLNQYASNLASGSAFRTTNAVDIQCTQPDGSYVISPIYSGANVMAYKQTPMLRAVSTPNSNRSNILQIPDLTCNSTTDYPYFLVRRRIEDRQLDCFNMDPYLTTTVLVTLEEVATSFGVALDALVTAVNVMRIDIFLPNKLQIRYLERNNKYPTAGLLKFKDFEDNFAQIRYVLSA